MGKVLPEFFQHALIGVHAHKRMIFLWTTVLISILYPQA